VGCIVDGCPPGMPLTEADIQPQMTRRRPGQSALTTPRDEKDRVQIQSGTEFGVTLGTPIGMLVLNENQRPKDYGNSTMDLYPRPSHADFTYLEKYGVKASSGGGRSSARETIGNCFFLCTSFLPLKRPYIICRPCCCWSHSGEVSHSLPQCRNRRFCLLRRPRTPLPINLSTSYPIHESSFSLPHLKHHPRRSRLIHSRPMSRS
jgi:Chorismate synthase